MAAPAKYNITIYRGDDFLLPFRLKDSNGAYYNLTGKIGRAQLRPTADADTVLAEFTVTVDPVVPGQVNVRMLETLTASLPVGTAVYDVEISNADGTGRRTWLTGSAKIIQQVTR